MKSDYWCAQMLAGSLLDAVKSDFNKAKDFFGATAALSGDFTKLRSVIFARALLEAKPDEVSKIMADTLAAVERLESSAQSESGSWKTVTSDQHKTAYPHLIGEYPQLAFTRRVCENLVAQGLRAAATAGDVTALRHIAETIVRTANEDTRRSGP